VRKSDQLRKTQKNERSRRTDRTTKRKGIVFSRKIQSKGKKGEIRCEGKRLTESVRKTDRLKE
jgi:hypothetical protein